MKCLLVNRLSVTKRVACISGRTTVRPLSGDALRLAFSYFDKDMSGYVSLVHLEAGMQTLG